MKTKHLVFTAIFLALIFLTTSLFKIPISIGWGYVHFGDLAVMLSGMLLGPVLGSIAAAFGSSLADITGGFLIYAIPTFIVKGTLAFAVGSLYKKYKDTQKDMPYKFKVVLHSVLAIVIVVGGYFITDVILAHFAFVDAEGSRSIAYALLGVLPNLIQVAFGVITSLLFYLPLKKPFDDIYYK